MKKDKRFLNRLENQLLSLKKSKREEIINKYSNIIRERKDNGEKITQIISSFGDIEELAKKEIEIIKENNKINKENIKKVVNNIIEKILIVFKQIKNKISSLYLLISKKYFINRKHKNIKKPIKKEEKSIEEKFEKNIFCLQLFLSIIIFVAVFFVSSIFMSSVFAVLDGVKVYGVCLFLFGLTLLCMWGGILLYININKIYVNKRFHLVYLFFVIICMSFGVAYSLRQYYKLENITEVSSIYSFVHKREKYTLPQEKLIISFNSNYKTHYVIDYDPSLDGALIIEIGYYEQYYNYYLLKKGNNIYISLKPDNRSRLSAYIKDIKDNKICDSNEMARYTVRIRINEKDKDRIVVY